MRLTWTLLAIFFTDACATSEPASGSLNRAALRMTHPKTIVATDEPPPAFEGITSAANTASSVAVIISPVLGFIGLALRQHSVVNEGDDAQRQGLYDPADRITAYILHAIARRFSLSMVAARAVVKPPVVVVSRPSAGQPSEPGTFQLGVHPERVPKTIMELARDYRGADLVLDVQTTKWGFFPVRVGHYGIRYEGRLRLVDARNESIIAEGSCAYESANSDDAPTYDEFLADKGRVLKASLSLSEDFCMDVYRRRILGLYGQTFDL